MEPIAFVVESNPKVKTKFPFGTTRKSYGAKVVVNGDPATADGTPLLAMEKTEMWVSVAPVPWSGISPTPSRNSAAGSACTWATPNKNGLPATSVSAPLVWSMEKASTPALADPCPTYKNCPPASTVRLSADVKVFRGEVNGEPLTAVSAPVLASI